MEIVSKKMEQLHLRINRHLPAIVRILALTGIVWMVGGPHGARASQIWDGPAIKQVGGAPSILAETTAAPASAAQNASARSVTTGNASNGAPHPSTGGAAAAKGRVTTAGVQGASPAGAVGNRHAVTAKATTSGGTGGSIGKTTSTASTSPALNLPTYAPVGDSGGQSLDGPAILGLVFKFFVVLALLFIVLRVLKAIMPGARGKRAGRDRPMLLHSEAIGDKQRILLLDLGGKLVAAGVAGTTMTTLATIEDADAVDTIRARYAPLAEAVPGYQEGKTPVPLSQSFMETLKRAGIVGQRQTGWGPATPVAPAVPTIASVRREPPTPGASDRRRVSHGGEGSPRPVPAGQPAVEPVLHEALEAMRAVRRRVEGA